MAKLPAQLPLGRIVDTPGALRLLSRLRTNPTSLLSRHSRGDWGDVDPEDRTANDTCLRTAGRILSSYRLDADNKVWVITEADRSSTCILLPEEY